MGRKSWDCIDFIEINLPVSGQEHVHSCKSAASKAPIDDSRRPADSVRRLRMIPALERAFAHDTMAVIEERIEGREVGCAVLGTDDLFMGEVDEIELSEGFFDYTEKYTLKTSKSSRCTMVMPKEEPERTGFTNRGYPSLPASACT